MTQLCQMIARAVSNPKHIVSPEGLELGIIANDSVTEVVYTTPDVVRSALWLGYIKTIRVTQAYYHDYS